VLSAPPRERRSVSFAQPREMTADETYASISDEMLSKYEVIVRAAFRKQLKFARLPDILCLHLCRLMGDAKVDAHVSLGLLLPLGDYCAYPADDYAKTSAGLPGARAARAAPNVSGPMYVLSSVVVHHGTPLGGHFTTFRRVESLNTLFKLGVAKSRQARPATGRSRIFLSVLLIRE